MRELLGQSTRFAVVGLANTAIGLSAMYASLYILRTGPALANAIGYAIGFGTGFLMNRMWTFGDRRPMGQLMPRYVFVAAISYLFNLAAVLVSIHYFRLDAYIAQLPGILVYTSLMFLGCRWLVFKIRT